MPFSRILRFYICRTKSVPARAMDGCERTLDGNAVHIEYVETGRNGWKKEVPGLGVQARDVEGGARIGGSEV